MQGLAGDEGCRQGREEGDDGRDVFGASAPGDTLAADLLGGGGAVLGGEVVLGIDLDSSRQDRVHTHAVRAEFAGQGSGKALESGLGGAVGDEAGAAGAGR